MASSKGVDSKVKFKFSAPVGKVSFGKPYSSPTNPLPNHKRNESLTGHSKPSQKAQTSYAGKNATSTGFVTTRAREFK
jgi:hypothetical protein